jgi:hypothetical protein
VPTWQGGRREEAMEEEARDKEREKAHARERERLY